MKPALLVSEEHGVQHICLNRRSRLNAYDLEIARQLLDLFERAAEREDLVAIVIGQEGGPFCVGHDFHHFSRLFRNGDVESYRRLQETLRDIWLLMRRLPQLVVAVVDGTAAGGGCTLALAADCRIAGPEATLGHPAVAFGFPAELASGSFLAAAGGSALALEMLSSGRLLDAAETGRRHLAEVSDQPAAAAARLAESAGRMPTDLRRRLKRSVYREAGPDARRLDLEIEQQLRFFVSEDCRNAFARLEKAGGRDHSGR